MTDDDKKPTYFDMPARLKAARVSRQLTRPQLGLAAGLDRKTCANIEEGKVKPNIYVATIERLAQALQVSPRWLAFGDDEAAAVAAASAALPAPRPRLLLPAPAPVEAPPPEKPRIRSHRHPSIYFPHDMGLPYCCDPVVECIRDSFDESKRDAVARGMVEVLLDRHPDRIKTAVNELDGMLCLHRPPLRPAEVAWVINALRADSYSRSWKALEIIIDAGLSVTSAELRHARWFDPIEPYRPDPAKHAHRECPAVHEYLDLTFFEDKVKFAEMMRRAIVVTMDALDASAGPPQARLEASSSLFSRPPSSLSR